jgi:hypothetical protein
VRAHSPGERGGPHGMEPIRSKLQSIQLELDQLQASLRRGSEERDGGARRSLEYGGAAGAPDAATRASVQALHALASAPFPKLSDSRAESATDGGGPVPPRAFQSAPRATPAPLAVDLSRLATVTVSLASPEPWRGEEQEWAAGPLPFSPASRPQAPSADQCAAPLLPARMTGPFRPSTDFASTSTTPARAHLGATRPLLSPPPVGGGSARWGPQTTVPDVSSVPALGSGRVFSVSLASPPPQPPSAGVVAPPMLPILDVQQLFSSSARGVRRTRGLGTALSPRQLPPTSMMWPSRDGGTLSPSAGQGQAGGRAGPVAVEAFLRSSAPGLPSALAPETERLSGAETPASPPATGQLNDPFFSARSLVGTPRTPAPAETPRPTTVGALRREDHTAPAPVATLAPAPAASVTVEAVPAAAPAVPVAPAPVPASLSPTEAPTPHVLPEPLLTSPPTSSSWASALAKAALDTVNARGQSLAASPSLLPRQEVASPVAAEGQGAGCAFAADGGRSSSASTHIEREEVASAAASAAMAPAVVEARPALAAAEEAQHGRPVFEDPRSRDPASFPAATVVFGLGAERTDASEGGAPEAAVAPAAAPSPGAAAAPSPVRAPVEEEEAEEEEASATGARPPLNVTEQVVLALLDGHVFIKHGRIGRPHSRLVWLDVSTDELGLRWGPEAKGTVNAGSKWASLGSVQGISKGASTGVLASASLAASKSPRFFSIRFRGGGGKESLDLEAASEVERDVWAGTLSQLIGVPGLLQQTMLHLVSSGQWEAP